MLLFFVEVFKSWLYACILERGQKKEENLDTSYFLKYVMELGFRVSGTLSLIQLISFL